MTSRQQNADKCFNAIMELQVVGELKDIAKKLLKFQQNTERYSVTDISLPNYLWLLKRGGGLSTCVNAFAEYLYAAKIIEFSGTVKYFEFIPAYTNPDTYFSELTRLNNIVSEIAGHYRHFKGIACIILDEWINHTDEANFLNIFDYIANHNDKLLAVFCVHTNDKTTIERIQSAIIRYMRFETISLGFPNAVELAEFIETKYFKTSDFHFAEDAKRLLIESIGSIIEGKNFNGFVTIKQIANDILYSLLTSDLSASKITSKMISNFEKDSDYISRIKSAGKNNPIGFK